MTAPRTRFGRLASGHAARPSPGAAVASTNTSIDWARVVLDEPSQITKWILYLHKRQHPEASNLFAALQTVLESEIQSIKNRSTYRERSCQWSAYRDANLPCVLIDLLLEPGLFSVGDDDPSRKKVSYVYERRNVLLIISL